MENYKEQDRKKEKRIEIDGLHTFLHVGHD